MMPQAAQYQYYYSSGNAVPNQEGHRHHNEEDGTEEVANFLLSLKHRSVTPEPALLSMADPRGHHLRGPPRHDSGYFQYPPYAYDGPQYLERPLPAHSLDPYSSIKTDDFSFEELLGDSTLVLIKDRDLVPDALFVAMAQMKMCKLTLADRVGCYKSREIGFIGMCCKHCGGQPGFGRYYPNSVRSLAQTTTSQTILKHVGNKCRFAPPRIRDAVLELQRQQALQEGASASGRPRYGSRKIFFQRVWGRLHGSGPSDDDTASTTTKQTQDDAASHDTPSDLEEEGSLATAGSADVDGEFTKRKSRFGSLPLNKRVKVTSPHHGLSAAD